MAFLLTLYNPETFSEHRMFRLRIKEFTFYKELFDHNIFTITHFFASS